MHSRALREKGRLIRSQTKRNGDPFFQGQHLRKGKQNSFACGSGEYNVKLV